MKNTKQNILFLLLFLFSCGKNVTDNELRDSEQNITSEGTYWARLVPVNSKVSETITGEVKITHYGDEFKVQSKIKNASSKTHRQFLHTGSMCPNIDHDINLDGIIDAQEAREALGDILIPFDGDISNINLGFENFPSGSFTYEKSTSFSLMASDPDFKKNQYALERRVVTIWEDLSGSEIPIACGILTQITTNSENGNTWDTDTNSGNPGKYPGGKVPGDKPPRDNKPPVYDTPPINRGGIFRRIRNWASRIFHRGYRDETSGKPNDKL